MKSKLLKDSNGAKKCIEELAGTKSRPVSESTKKKIELASKIALERIKHNSNVYMESYLESSDVKLGGPALIRRK